MAKTNIRQSPSGPNVEVNSVDVTPGSGMIMRTSFASAAIDATFLLSGAGQVELKEDPGNTLAPFARPELDEIPLNAGLQIECVVPAKTFDSWVTNTVITTIETSIDDGANWVTFASQSTEIPGQSAAGNEQNVPINLKTAPFPASGITGLVEGGSLQVRAMFNKTGGTDDALSFTGQGGIPGFTIELHEVIP